jgi:bifunctional non-homologous end joining protein LigD
VRRATLLLFLYNTGARADEVAQIKIADLRIDFLEWTDANHLRHPKFVALRDDKEPRKVVRET